LTPGGPPGPAQCGPGSVQRFSCTMPAIWRAEIALGGKGWSTPMVHHVFSSSPGHASSPVGCRGWQRWPIEPVPHGPLFHGPATGPIRLPGPPELAQDDAVGPHAASRRFFLPPVRGQSWTPSAVFAPSRFWRGARLRAAKDGCRPAASQFFRRRPSMVTTPLGPVCFPIMARTARFNHGFPVPLARSRWAAEKHDSGFPAASARRMPAAASARAKNKDADMFAALRGHLIPKPDLAPLPNLPESPEAPVPRRVDGAGIKDVDAAPCRPSGQAAVPADFGPLGISSPRPGPDPRPTMPLPRIVFFQAGGGKLSSNVDRGPPGRACPKRPRF